MDLPSGLSIAPTDWEQTPRAVQGVVITLWQMIGLLRQEIATQQDQIIRQQNQITQQQEQIAQLQGEVAKLHEQVNRNSSNSSKPPSSDGPQTPPRPKSEPSGRKAGGQKGIVAHEGVEPTNNSAERPLRRGVLWRKRCFGTQSKSGSLFVERILTTVLTLRQQNRDGLDFLTQACIAKIGAAHVPSLLPTN